MRTECEKYKAYMTNGRNDVWDHKIYKFPNCWGASVVDLPGMLGIELMPVSFDDEGDYSWNWEPFANLSEEEVESHLTDIFDHGPQCQTPG